MNGIPPASDMYTRAWASLELASGLEDLCSWLADERDEREYAERAA